MNWRFVLLLAIATRAWACSCGGDFASVKQTWQKAPFVFLGTVDKADPDDDPSQTIFQVQTVRIHVDEAFKGVSKGQTIELYQPGTDCDAKFRTGERAVFYLQRGAGPGSFSVPWCTRAIGNAESGGDDLLFLRGLPKSAAGTRLSGEVELYEHSPTEGFRRVKGLPNVKVKISGPNGFTKELRTNTAGAYEVFGLAPGRYSVDTEVPLGLKATSPLIAGSLPIRGDNSAVDLTSDGGVGVSFVLEADTRLSGRMLDAKGVPLAGVCIDLEPLAGRGANGARFSDCSKKDGVFTMSVMPPGDYLLVANDDIQFGPVKSKSTLYYPGVRDRKQAKTITVEPSKYLGDLDIRLPARETRYTVSGKLQFSDGVPVPRGTVTFTSLEHGYSETTGVSPDGSFGLPVIAGMNGQLKGQVGVLELELRSCPEFKVEPRRIGVFRIMATKLVSLSIDADQEGLTLELPSPSCPSWRK